MTLTNWIYSLKKPNDEIQSEQVQVITLEENQQTAQIKYGQ